MKKFVAAITALFTFFSSASVLAEEHVVYCSKGQDCHVTLDLRPAPPPAPPLVPTPANTPAPADNSWIGWTVGGVLTAAAIVVGSVLIASAVKRRDRESPDGEKPDIVVDVVLKNPEPQLGGGS